MPLTLFYTVSVEDTEFTGALHKSNFQMHHPPSPDKKVGGVVHPQHKKVHDWLIS